MTTNNTYQTNTEYQGNSNLGVYLHLPFCQKKCDYCSFVSLVNQPETTVSDYLQDLLRESVLQQETINLHAIRNHLDSSQYLVDTLFIGGGTPSLISGEAINELLEGMHKQWFFSDPLELTMECNPNSINPKNLAAYHHAGVNRLSIGVQSFEDTMLKQLGRLHDAKSAQEAVFMARNEGFENINLDLMFGLPGQSMKQWMRTLKMAISLEPTHLSLYTLQIEEGTKLYQDYRSEKIPLVDVELDRKCYHEAIEFLKDNGFDQYEISNFSKPGYECKHNIKYWSMDNYLGLGLNASSYINGYRWKNYSSMEQWTAAMKDNRPPIENESIKMDSRRDEMGIFIFTGLRKTQGISLIEFKNRFGLDFFQAFLENIEHLLTYRSKGLLDWTDQKGGRLWLTQAGIDYSNEILSEFV